MRERVKPSEADAFAQEFGVPAGAWSAAQSGWQERMLRDPQSSPVLVLRQYRVYSGAWPR